MPGSYGLETISDAWTKEQLMGKAPVEGYTLDSEPYVKGKIKPQLWGVPGYLTEDEVDVYFKVKEQVTTRGGDFAKTVYSFGEEEGECWALSRWCRARKYVLEDIILMIEQATETRDTPGKHDFYPDPKAALGCDMSVYFDQFPQCYSGFAKNGAPLFFSKPGLLNVDAVECITNLEGILKFHWFIMMHDFGDRLRSQRKEDPSFNKFSCVCVLDLANLTTTQLSQRALAIIKEQSAIDSLCFPETLNRMVLVNSPRFFSAFWTLIKGWLDPRTAAKIDVITSRKTWEAKLLEYADKDQLPSDYGGTGPSTLVTLAATQPEGLVSQSTEVMKIRGYLSVTKEIAAGEALDIVVWTRSTAGADFVVTDANTKETLIDKTLAKHGGSDDPSEMPTSTSMTPTTRLVGPKSIKIRGDCHAGRFTTNNFCLCLSVYPA